MQSGKAGGKWFALFIAVPVVMGKSWRESGKNMEESCLHGDFRRFYTVVCDNGFPVGGSKWRKSVYPAGYRRFATGRKPDFRNRQGDDMDNFTFYNPTRIEFGRDKEKLLGQYVAADGIRKVMLCYGSDRIKRSGLFDTVAGSLGEKGIEVTEFGGVVSNPVISTVRKAIESVRANGIEAIVSVGGGSVLDSAKAIAAGTLYDDDVWDLFIGKGVIEKALPVYDVITMAASGSEMNPTGVVTNEETRQKLFIAAEPLFPRVSVINPALMRSVAKDYLVYSAADIIAHSIEGYFTASVQPHFPSRIVESVINTVIETTEILLENPENDDVRGEFAWAATMALNGMTLTGTSGYSYPNHMIEHSLSALYNVPHGAGLSVVMPAWMKWYSPKNPGQFERFAKKIFGLSTPEEGIVALENWFNRIGTPTRLSQLGIGEKDLPAIVENVLANAQAFGLAGVYTGEIVTRILENAL